MSPWTKKQVGLLLSKDSPLNSAQQQKMKAELKQPGMIRPGRPRVKTAHPGLISVQRAISGKGKKY